MQAKIITIGDEILIGQIVDTNSAWISAELNSMGIRVVSKLSVADSAHAIMGSINAAINSADLVIVTGGLGPTKDDITKKVLADMFGCPMVEDKQTYQMVEKMLALRGIEFNELNRAQALVPECCTVLPNHNGTAPGMWFERNGAVVVSLPGVPFEMKELMKGDVMPRLQAYFNLRSIVHKTMITFGLAESVLAQTIEQWENALPSLLKLAYLPNPSCIRLRLSAYDVERPGAETEIDRQFALLEEIIPGYVLGYGDATIESAVAEILSSRRMTLAVAESCTGGAISSRFTAMPGASDYFLAAVTSYSNAAKTDILGVNPGDIEQYGAVSKQVAEQMAQGVRRISKADYTIATTGIAGPGGGTAEKPVGTVWIAVATPRGVLSQKMVYGNLRAQNIERSSAAAINLLRLVLIDKESIEMSQGIL